MKRDCEKNNIIVYADLFAHALERTISWRNPPSGPLEKGKKGENDGSTLDTLRVIVTAKMNPEEEHSITLRTGNRQIRHRQIQRKEKRHKKRQPRARNRSTV
uniref:Uncharacterized protein n=1 Tax=Pristionchus pacificus TaxID=54126 RepID=A0A2A6BKL9_PRIPA|eukprot:PDM66373.1 hypothetical protein PRIPAC_47790 [Pristionchus pacificus]